MLRLRYVVLCYWHGSQVSRTRLHACIKVRKKVVPNDLLKAAKILVLCEYSNFQIESNS